MFLNAAILLSLLAVGSLGCLCPMTTQKLQYTQADVVAKVKITNKVNNPQWISYTADVEQVFKPTGNSSQFTQTLLTPSTALRCGSLLLQNEKEYLIAAKKDGNNWKIDQCKEFPQNKLGRVNIAGALPWDQVSLDLQNSIQTGKF